MDVHQLAQVEGNNFRIANWKKYIGLILFVLFITQKFNYYLSCLFINTFTLWKLKVSDINFIVHFLGNAIS